nr:zinc finger, CCHC-type [Tanacetum cinerariifolium]
MSNELRVSLILKSLSKDYDKFVQNYNIHSMGKTVVELHVMLKLAEKGILKKAYVHVVLAIRIQKKRNKPQAATNGKGNRKGYYNNNHSGLLGSSLQSNDEGPFKIVKFKETPTEGALHLAPEHDRVFAYHTPEEKERYKADLCATNILLQGLPKDIYTLINHYTYAKDIWDNVKMLLEGLTPTDDLLENLTKTVSLPAQSYKAHLPHTNNQLITSSNARNQDTVQNNMIVIQNVQGHIARQCTHPKQQQNSKYFKKKMLVMQAQKNRVVSDEEQLLFIVGRQTNTFDDDVDEAHVQDLAFNEDHVFQANQCDDFDSDVNEAPTAQTMFMENLSSADPIYNEAGPSYDSNILSEVQDHNNYLDSVDDYKEVHEMHNDVQQNYIFDSDAKYTGDSNIIPYDQYVKNNAEQVVQSNVSSMPNNALMMIINDMHDQATQCASANEQMKAVNKSLTAELT